MNYLKSLLQALKKVFGEKISWLYLLFGTVFFAFIYIYTPIWLTPSNTLLFFISITPLWTLFLIFLLSLLMGLLLAMQIFVWKTQHSLKMREVGTGTIAGMSGLIPGLFSTATCATCVSALFSFLLPPAGIFFLIEYRWLIITISFVLVFFSIFLLSKRITQPCRTCSR